MAWLSIYRWRGWPLADVATPAWHYVVVIDSRGQLRLPVNAAGGP